MGAINSPRMKLIQCVTPLAIVGQRADVLPCLRYFSPHDIEEVGQRRRSLLDDEIGEELSP